MRVNVKSMELAPRIVRRLQNEISIGDLLEEQDLNIDYLEDTIVDVIEEYLFSKMQEVL